MKKILALASLFVSFGLGAATLRTDNSQQFLNAKVPRNFILNSGAESTDLNVTESAAIHSRTTAAPIEGDGSHLIDATGSGQTVCFQASNFTQDVRGGTCEARFKYAYSGSLYKAYAKINSVIVSDNVNNQLSNFPSGDDAGTFSATFPCGTVAPIVPEVCIESTSASASTLYVDSVYVGEATNIGTVAQPEVVVRASAAATQSVATATIAQMTFSTEDYDVYSEFASNVFTAKRPGKYLVTCGAEWIAGGSTAQAVVIGVRKNGTEQTVTRSINDGVAYNLRFFHTDTVDLTVGQTTDCSFTHAVGSNRDIQNKFVTIVRYPTNNETIARLDAPYLFPTAYTPTITGAGTVTSNAATAQCLGGLLYMQGRFTAGTVSATEARIAMPSSFTSADSSLIPLLTQVGAMSTNIATATSYQTLIEPSVTYLTVGYQNAGVAGVTKKNGDSVWGTGAIVTWFATVPVTASSPCPKSPQVLIPGSVYSSSAGVERIEYVRTTAPRCTADPCSIASQSGGISSVSRNSTGIYTINFVAGTFSAAPTCVVTTVYQGAAASIATGPSAAATATTYRFEALAPNTLAVTDSMFNAICMGPR